MSLNLQKATFFKRFSAWMFDAMTVVVIAMGLLIALLRGFGYASLEEQHRAGREIYYTQVSAEYNIDLFMDQETYEKLDEAGKQQYADAYNKAEALIDADEELTAISKKMFSMMILCGSGAIFLGVFALHFVIPLLFKNGQTLGKKMFGLAVMRTNHVKLRPAILFVRSIIGLFVMETMAVLLMCMMGLMGIIFAVLVQVLQIYLLIKTKTRSSIHDLLADTVVIDLGSQRIFDTEEEMLEYVKQEAAEQAEAQVYMA